MWNEEWRRKATMWNVECGMWNVECGMWNVKCGMWNDGGLRPIVYKPMSNEEK